MKFYYFALITSLVLLPLAAGRPPRHHGPEPPQDHKIPQRGGRNKPHRGGRNKPHRNLRQQTQQRRAADATTNPKDNTTNLPQVECDTPNPLTKLDSACPCFDQARIASLIDFSTAEYCDFYQSLPGEDPCNHSNYESTDLYASSPEEALQGEPPIYQSSYVSFSVNKDSDPDYGSSTCYASVSVSKSSISYQNFDYEGNSTTLDDFGDSHTYYMSQSLTDEQYDACLNVLNERKGQLPDNCVIGNGEW